MKPKITETPDCTTADGKFIIKCVAVHMRAGRSLSTQILLTYAFVFLSKLIRSINMVLCLIGSRNTGLFIAHYSLFQKYWNDKGQLSAEHEFQIVKITYIYIYTPAPGS